MRESRSWCIKNVQIATCRAGRHAPPTWGWHPQRPSFHFGEVETPGPFRRKAQFQYFHTEGVKSQALLLTDSRNGERHNEPGEGQPSIPGRE